MRDYLGASDAISVSNGTVALHLALVGLGIGPGDEVIVPTLTYIASANAIRYTGARVVFCDSEPEHWQLDLDDVARRITPRTRAIMAVHLYGHPCNMEGLAALASRHGIKVVEDCAEALGTRFDSTLVGTFGDVGTFSFFGNKTLTTGEGGLVTCRSAEVGRYMRKLRGQGLDGEREYWHDAIGYNYRMTNICAAIGCAQFEQLSDVLERKRQLAIRYKELLKGLPLRVHGESNRSTHSYWMVSILLNSPADRDRLRSHLKHAGIETRPVFYPIHTMSMYAAEADGQDFPVAVDLAARGINLPSYPDLNDNDIAVISASIRRYYS
jgi:perosamine synthetase